MSEVFQEKIVRLENQLAAAHMQVQQQAEDLASHSGSWVLELQREGAGDARWEVASNGEFEWEGDGITIRLRKA